MFSEPNPFAGISYYPEQNLYEATIGAVGRAWRLERVGLFASIEEAVEARKTVLAARAAHIADLNTSNPAPITPTSEGRITVE